MAFLNQVPSNRPPLVAHIIHRLAVGGLENGLVNLINRTPLERFRHAVISLTNSTDFRDRIMRKDIPIVSLNRHDGLDFSIYGRLRKLLRRLRPSIVHTRNLSGLEYLIPAALAGVPHRIHGEHGRDMYDLDGSSFKYNLLRKALRPLVHHYVAVSCDLAKWLVNKVGIDAARVTQISNGVDLRRFSPHTSRRMPIGLDGFAPPATMVVSTVGRMEAVKDQLTLVKAFLYLLDIEPTARDRLRLVMVGDGPLRNSARELLAAAGADNLAWLPGERSDIPEIMRSTDLFVLPSLREGISNTILEAMASGLPVVATWVGGNPELVVDGETGLLVPPADPVAMASALRTYFLEASQLARHGEAGRKRVMAHFGIDAMVSGYLTLYDAVLARRSC